MNDKLYTGFQQVEDIEKEYQVYLKCEKKRLKAEATQKGSRLKLNQIKLEK